MPFFPFPFPPLPAASRPSRPRPSTSSRPMPRVCSRGAGMLISFQFIFGKRKKKEKEEKKYSVWRGFRRDLFPLFSVFFFFFFSLSLVIRRFSLFSLLGRADWREGLGISGWRMDDGWVWVWVWWLPSTPPSVWDTPETVLPRIPVTVLAAPVTPLLSLFIVERAGRCRGRYDSQV